MNENISRQRFRTGRLFERQVYFVPELLMASETMHAGLAFLAPRRDAGPRPIKNRIVPGVAEGDIHEIGKNLVATMFQAAGWDVIELGPMSQPMLFWMPCGSIPRTWWGCQR